MRTCCLLHLGVWDPVVGSPGLRFTPNLPPSAIHPSGCCIQFLGYRPSLHLIISHASLLAHLSLLNMLPKVTSILHSVNVTHILALEWLGLKQHSALLTTDSHRCSSHRHSSHRLSTYCQAPLLLLWVLVSQPPLETSDLGA